MKTRRHVLVFAFIGVFLLWFPDSTLMAEQGTEFPGTVLTVDLATGKFAVKKDSGGTRFTFIASGITKFHGVGLQSIKELKKDDKVIVTYQVQGSRYIALSVTKQ